jgi:hypothetical protein
MDDQKISISIKHKKRSRQDLVGPAIKFNIFDDELKKKRNRIIQQNRMRKKNKFD